jgi:hypothetical protein
MRGRILLSSFLLFLLLFPWLAISVKGSGEVTVKPLFEIVSCVISPNKVTIGEKVLVSVTIKNNDNTKRSFYVNLAIQNPKGDWEIIPYVTITLEPRTADSTTLRWFVSTSAIPGYYNAKITVWTHEPHKVESKEVLDAFEILSIPKWEKISGPWEKESDSYGFFSAILVKPIAVDPNNPDTIYVGSVKGGGLYKSIDGGHTWSEISEGLPRLGWPYSSKYWPITAIAVAPTNPNVIYVGTSAPDSYTVSFLGVELHGMGGMGIYKTLDGGKTWFPANGPEYDKSKYFPLASVSSIVVSPVNPDVVYVGTIGGGIWKTVDGGITWEQIWSLPLNREILMEVNVLAISPANPNIIYATAYNYAALEFEGLSEVTSPPLLLKSQDGVHFTEKILPMKVDDMVIDKEDANKIYFITDYYRVYTSINGGEGWNDISGKGVHTISANPLPFVTRLGPTTGRVCSIALQPFKNIIYASNEFPSYIYFSPDNGQNWYPFNSGLDPVKDHVEKLIFTPSLTPYSGKLYAVTAAGIFKIEV